MISSRFYGAEEGPLVLVLNGGMMSIGGWRPVTDRMPGFRFLGCDFAGQLLSPGRGRSSISENADDVLELLDGFEIDEIHVLGASFGGFVGLDLAARQPSRVSSLCAVTVVAQPPVEMLRGSERSLQLIDEVLAGQSAEPFWDDLVRGVYSPAYRDERGAELSSRGEQVAALPRVWFEGLRGIVEALAGLDLREALPRIVCPTLVVATHGDQVMPLEHSLAVAQAIPGARVALHSGAGHALVLEDSAWLADVAARFFSGVVSQRGASGVRA